MKNKLLPLLSSIPSRHPSCILSKEIHDILSSKDKKILEELSYHCKSIVTADELLPIYMAKYEISKNHPKVTANGFPDTLQGIKLHKGKIRIISFRNGKKQYIVFVSCDYTELIGCICLDGKFPV